MSDMYKLGVLVVILLTLLLSTYSYHSGKNREAYRECPRVGNRSCTRHTNRQAL